MDHRSQGCEIISTSTGQENSCLLGWDAV